jgi:peptide/nickel transport system substrate-binding protein
MTRGGRASFALLLLAACWPSVPHAQGRDVLTIGMSQFPSTLHPLIDAMAAKTYVLNMTRRPVTAYDKEWKLECMLCTELPTFENGGARVVDVGDGKQGVELTVRLHPDAKWGDGKPVSSRDVIFTWQVGRHPRSGVGEAELFRRILAIEAKDEKTVTIRLDRVHFKYNDLSGLQILPEHLERKPFEADPFEYKNRTLFDTDPANPALHFGPYRISEVVKNAHIALERNPGWYGQQPAFRRIVVKVIGNISALEANFLSGDVDYVAGELGLTIEQVLALEAKHKDRYRFVYKPGLSYEHLNPNLEHPILGDRRVRQALLHAVDRDAIVKQLFAGRQQVAHSSVNPLDWMATDSIPHYRYDPARAKQLLEDAGWKLGAGGIRQNDKGEKLSFSLMTTAGNRSRELVQQVLQSQWRQVGIDARIKNEPARVFFGTTVRERKFDGIAMFAWISAPESVPQSTLHSTMIPTRENNFSGQNVVGYNNKAMDELIDGIEIELDREKRRALWHRLQRLYAEDLPALPLFFRAEPYIFPNWLEGIEPTGHQFYSTLRVEHWRAR